MVLIHGRRPAPAEAPPISRRKIVWGSLAAVGVLVTGKFVSDRIGENPPVSPGQTEPGLAGGTGGGQGGEAQYAPDQLKVRAIGDAIRRSPDSQEALAKLLGVSAASLQIETPPPQPWIDTTYAQITASGGQDSVIVALPQRSPGFSFKKMYDELKGSAEPPKWFTGDGGDFVCGISAPNYSRGGAVYGWDAKNTPRESVFTMNVNSNVLAGMAPDQKIDEILAATQVLHDAGVFQRPVG